MFVDCEPRPERRDTALQAEKGAQQQSHCYSRTPNAPYPGAPCQKAAIARQHGCPDCFVFLNSLHITVFYDYLQAERQMTEFAHSLSCLIVESNPSVKSVVHTQLFHCFITRHQTLMYLASSCILGRR